MTIKYLVFIILISLVINGCGGSSGNSNSDAAEIPLTINISGDLTPAVGQSVALITTIDNQNTDIATIDWIQTSGTPLELVATNSAVLAFDIEKSDSYSFDVNVITSDGIKLSKSINFTTTTVANILNVRRDFASREGNKVSFKLSSPTDFETGNVINGAFSNIKWVKTAGPNIVIDEKNTNALTAIFNAPYVDEDTILTLDVSAQHPNGEIVTDKVHLLIQNIDNIPTSSIYDKVVAKVTPYNLNAPMAAGLKKCIYANYFSSPCSLSDINLIGQEHSDPTVDQIMDRVITSHPWMADNFKQFLIEQDPYGDFKKLLRSVSAIVISYDIRPSYYWVATGAIHLDPEDLWLTPAQRDVIDVAPDYRNAFGQELQYIMPWRYVKNNQYASSYYPNELRINRTIADLVPDLSSLLYHELAHANDNFPSSSLSSINAKSIYDAYQSRNGVTIADLLTTTYPKNSIEMTELGQVNFKGKTPTSLQKSYTPNDIANFFSHDNAPTEYAYSSAQEDVATLFDATMMSARYGIERDEAVTETSSPYTISWGQRGRIKDPVVEPRSKFVFELIFPELNSTEIYNLIPNVRTLATGYSWNQALTQGFVSNAVSIEKSNAISVNEPKEIEIHRPIQVDLLRRYE